MIARRKQEEKPQKCGRILMTWHATILIRPTSLASYWSDRHNSAPSLCCPPAYKLLTYLSPLHIATRLLQPGPRFRADLWFFPDALYRVTLMEHFTLSSLCTGLRDKMVYRFEFYESYFCTKCTLHFDYGLRTCEVFARKSALKCNIEVIQQVLCKIVCTLQNWGKITSDRISVCRI
jgi:hypothetical protein